jgi:ABC-type glycerol-3-phosphate transport system permease component
MFALISFTSMPLVYLVSTAFKPIDELFVFPPVFITTRPTMANFNELLTALSNSTVPFTRYFFNSVVVTAATVCGSLLVCSMGAYSLSKLKLPFKRLIFNIIVASLMIAPPAAATINYIILQRLHLVNTYWAILLPSFAGSYYFFLLKQCFQELPNELIEAAKIDGCESWRIYTKIIMPLSKPALSTVFVFSFVNNWNNYNSVMLYIHDEALKTLPLALAMLQGGAGQIARQGAFGAAALLTTAPVIIVFLIMQSKVVKTMAHSGIK